MAPTEIPMINEKAGELLSCFFDVDLFAVSPDPFQIIEQTVFFIEDMNDDIAKIK